MNLVFFGTSPFAKDILEGIYKKHNILAVITQIDKPYGRKKILKPSAVKELALALNIPCLQPHKSSEIPQVLKDIESKCKIDSIIVVAYGKILPKEIVESYMCFNLHGSILPYFRGASPVQNSIMSDYSHFGLSVIAMDEGLDTGDIVAAKEVDRAEVEGKDIESVFKILAPHGISLMQSCLDSIHNLNRIKQDHAKATHCAKLQKGDGVLDLINARSCYLRYLALKDRNVSIEFNSGIIKINEISGYSNEAHNKAKGTIIEIDSKNARFLLACENGALWIDVITPPNKSRMNALSFMQSKSLGVDSVIV